jgi:integrase
MLADPDTLDGALTLEQARHNSVTLYAMFLLMLTSGLRPLEIPRIRPLHVDLLAGRISIHGKARSIGQAYRWLPIFSGLKEYLKLLVTPDIPGQRKHFFYLYGRKGLEWPVSSVTRLNRALGSVAEKAGFPTDLDLYGLRHRFRSDMLELNMPGHLLNYLMGHERPGDEAYNYYLERNLSELGPTFEEAARKIAVKYGVLR